MKRRKERQCGCNSAIHPGAANRVKEFVRTLEKSDIATILAALRLFQRTYEGVDAEQIRDDWEQFADMENNKFIEPLGTEDIDQLCEEIISVR